MAPTPGEVRRALAAVVASEEFRGSGQLVAFLRFAVEATLAGQTDRLAGLMRLTTAGDDYQTVMAVRPDDWRELSAAAEAAGVRLSRIGGCAAGSGVRVLGPDGVQIEPAGAGGWTHF